MKSKFTLISLLSATASLVQAVPRTSANYSIQTDAVAIAGVRAASTNYRVDSSAGSIGGISNAASPSELNKQGYAAQLYEVVSLSLTAPPTNRLNERATAQLQAAPRLDDTTLLASLDPSIVTWSLISGPIKTISHSGVVTADTVYQDAAAKIAGSGAGVGGQFTLTVLNLTDDDYGSYAGDGIDDAWQVQYFGENNPKAAPGADPDGDGENNLFEFVAGLNPTDASSHFTMSTAPVPNQSGEFAITFSPHLSDRTYSLQAKAQLSDPDWTTLTNTMVVDNGTQRTIVDLSAGGPAKFYHVEIAKP
jgi:hypothetical protein